jgi:hypothetical protein
MEWIGLILKNNRVEKNLFNYLIEIQLLFFLERLKQFKIRIDSIIF